MRSRKLPISVKFFYKDTKENELKMYIYLVSIYTNECYKYIILQYNLNIKAFYPRFFPYIVTVLFSNINPSPFSQSEKNLRICSIIRRLENSLYLCIL